MYFTSGILMEEPFEFLIAGFSAYSEGRYTFHRQRIQQNLPDGRISVDIYMPTYINYKCLFSFAINRHLKDFDPLLRQAY